MNEALALTPRLSEQTYALAQTQRVYVFDVPKGANKHRVARAVAEQFAVSVSAVNIANVKGKAKRTVSLSGKRRGVSGARSDTTKAYVKLAEGDSLPIFAAIEEAAEKEQATQETVDKAAAKAARPENDRQAAKPQPARRGLRLFKKQGDK